ncbi:MAG: NifB/NifX family molybdenum-iron cluster-binding protein [archaeon]
MKIAISSNENSIDGNIDQRFGRCRYFVIAEIEDNKIKSTQAVANEGSIQGHGAGIAAAKQLGNLGVNAVITGSLGPNATDVLRELEITAYHGAGTIQEAIDNFLQNKLEEISEVSEAHSGLIKAKESSSERVFFPLLEDNGMNSTISDHFGHAPFFGVYDVEKEKLEIIENNLDHEDPTKSPIDQIEEAVHPTTIFAKGIGGRAIGIIQQKGLSLKTGQYNTVGDAIKNFDKLDNQTQSCGHKH